MMVSNPGTDPRFLTDERLRKYAGLLFFAYRDFTSDPDRLLAEAGLGRAHHRALHFIGQNPGMPVTELLEILAITKQSLARVLRDLLERDLVEQKVGQLDRRQRLLYLTDAGWILEDTLSQPQRVRLTRSFQEAGPEAVHGFVRVLQLMTDWETRGTISRLDAGSGDNE